MAVRTHDRYRALCATPHFPHLLTKVAIKVLRWHMTETHSLLEAYTQELAALSHLLLHRRCEQRHGHSHTRNSSAMEPGMIVGAQAVPAAEPEIGEKAAAGAVADLAPAGALDCASAAAAGHGDGAGDEVSLHAHVLDFKGVATRRDGVQALVLGRAQALLQTAAFASPRLLQVPCT